MLWPLVAPITNLEPQIMKERIVVLAGSTGDLGRRLLAELLRRGACVRALTRKPMPEDKRFLFAKAGKFQAVTVDFDDPAALAKACEGAEIVVSTLSGLRPVIVGTQSKLLAAAVQAGVPRFMPSDFAIDFTKIPVGTNRNLNLREEFRQVVDAAPIRATSILNGAFTDMLTGLAPFILYRWRRILCWGDERQLMDWTTIDDTASFTSSAVLDTDSPRYLRIAGDQISARGMATMMTELTGRRHTVFRPGGPKLLSAMIWLTRAFSPSRDDIYPPWQGMQYMHNMYAGFAKFPSLDNDRYPMRWTNAREVVARHLRLA